MKLLLRHSPAVVAAALILILGSCRDPSAPEATWAEVDPPVVTEQTDDVRVAGGQLADGTYWAEIAPVSGTGEIVFRVVKARFGATCEEWAKDNGLEFCANDYAVESFPDAHVALDELAAVSVARPDGPGTNFSINPDVLKGLIRGDDLGEPEGYSWAAFPFVVVVTNGFVTSAEQLWVP